MFNQNQHDSKKSDFHSLSLSLSLHLRVLLRVRMLYYLRQEVIGDQAERILEGADSRSVDPLLSSRVSVLLSHRAISLQRTDSTFVLSYPEKYSTHPSLSGKILQRQFITFLTHLDGCFCAFCLFITLLFSVVDLKGSCSP